MALTEVTISPILSVLTHDGVGGANWVPNYDVLSGEVASDVLPGTMIDELERRFQRILTADPTLANATYAPRILRSLLIIGSAAEGVDINLVNEIDEEDEWKLTVNLTGKLYVGIPHSVDNPIVLVDPITAV